MQLSLAERRLLKERVLARYCDWAGLHAALHDGKGHTISQRSLDRYFAGQCNSDRTQRILTTLLPDAPAVPAPLPAPADDAAAAGSPARLHDPETFRLAFQLWVEMTTRLTRRSIGPDEVLVTDCHDAWEGYLTVGRDLLKSVPLYKNPEDPELRRLVQLMERVLNEGIRPYHERWAGAFRRWLTTPAYAAHLAAGLSPHEAQQRYPRWAELRADLLAATGRLGGYLAELEALVAHPTAPLVGDTGPAA